MVTVGLLGAIGLVFCLFGHRLLHFGKSVLRSPVPKLISDLLSTSEVPILSLAMSFFVVYCILKAHTEWSEMGVQLAALGMGITPSLLVHLFWFFTGHYFTLVFVFATFASFNLTLILFYTPFGE